MGSLGGGVVYADLDFARTGMGIILMFVFGSGFRIFCISEKLFWLLEKSDRLFRFSFSNGPFQSSE